MFMQLIQSIAREPKTGKFEKHHGIESRHSTHGTPFFFTKFNILI